MLALHRALKDTQMETYFTSKPRGDAPCSSFTVEGGANAAGAERARLGHRRTLKEALVR